MKLKLPAFIRRNKDGTPLTGHTWTFAPYAFTPGNKYVIELNSADIKTLEDIHAFKAWLYDNGINAHVMLTKSGNGIKPVTVKHLTEQL